MTALTLQTSDPINLLCFSEHLVPSQNCSEHQECGLCFLPHVFAVNLHLLKISIAGFERHFCCRMPWSLPGLPSTKRAKPRNLEEPFQIHLAEFWGRPLRICGGQQSNVHGPLATDLCKALVRSSGNEAANAMMKRAFFSEGTHLQPAILQDIFRNVWYADTPE